MAPKIKLIQTWAWLFIDIIYIELIHLRSTSLCLSESERQRISYLLMK